MRLARLIVLCAAATGSTALATPRPVRVYWSELVATDKAARDATNQVNTVVGSEVTRGGRALLGPADLKGDKSAAAALQACPGATCRDAAERVGADYVLLASGAQLGKEFALELKLVDPIKGVVVATHTDVASRPREVGPLTKKALEVLFQSVPATVEEVQQPVVTAPVVTPPVKTTDTPVVTPPVEEPPTVTKAGPSRLPAWAATGGGGAAAVVGAVLVGTALSFNGAKSGMQFSQAQQARASAQKRLVAGYALVGVGVAAAGAGVFMLLSEKPTGVAVVPTQGGAVLSVAGSF